MRLGMTDAERAQHVPGTGVATDGVKQFTIRHMNLTRSLRDVYDIRPQWGGERSGMRFIWINRDTGRPD